MMHGDLEIELQGEQVCLLPEGGVFWQQRHTLFVADTHFGKTASFRAMAFAVPGDPTTDDLNRLTQVLARTGARRLVVLGDFLHAKAGRTDSVLAAIEDWRHTHSDLDILLVRGNHDQRAGDPPDACHIDCVDEPWSDPPFALRHYPDPSADGYTLAGHLHPAVMLVGKGRQRAKLPCFSFGTQVGVLPAFGSFTGTALMSPQPGERIYVITEGEVIAVK